MLHAENIMHLLFVIKSCHSYSTLEGKKLKVTPKRLQREESLLEDGASTVEIVTNMAKVCFVHPDACLS